MHTYQQIYWLSNHNTKWTKWRFRSEHSYSFQVIQPLFLTVKKHQATWGQVTLTKHSSPTTPTTTTTTALIFLTLSFPSIPSTHPSHPTKLHLSSACPNTHNRPKNPTIPSRQKVGLTSRAPKWRIKSSKSCSCNNNACRWPTNCARLPSSTTPTTTTSSNATPPHPWDIGCIGGYECAVGGSGLWCVVGGGGVALIILLVILFC